MRCSSHSLISFLDALRYILSRWWWHFHKEIYCLLYCEINKYQILPHRLILQYLAFFFLIQKLCFDLLNYGDIQCCLYLIFIDCLKFDTAVLDFQDKTYEAVIDTLMIVLFFSFRVHDKFWVCAYIVPSIYGGFMRKKQGFQIVTFCLSCLYLLSSRRTFPHLLP